MNWADVEEMVQLWGGQFCLKGVMAVEDARRGGRIGCTGIVLSNHGGRQLDGSARPSISLPRLSTAWATASMCMMDGGIQRGTHILKALSLGAKAVGIGRYYLYALAAAGRPRCGACPRPLARGTRARHDVDGLHLRRATFAHEPEI